MDTLQLKSEYPVPKYQQIQMDILIEYNNHLIVEIDEMKLHPMHKEAVKEVLKKAISEMKIYHDTVTPEPEKRRGWILRLFNR